LTPALFESPYKALVVGAGGALGKAFVQAFQNDPHCLYAETVSRSLNPGFDLQDEAAIAQQSKRCDASGPFHIIVDATGALTIEGRGPEKALTNITHDALIKNFEINTVGPALVLRYFAPLLASGPTIYAKLSARVGSISDNQKGGWYGYRAAKAALNMVLQTAAIELQRKNPLLRVVALQPGTVRTPLSQPFSANIAHLLEPAESVAGMWAALKHLSPTSGAHFIDYKGEPIDW
jgi:NAD(P)-dependent dehydrogenase (short-subunit alcohol dehydrogenase family)